MSRDLTKDAMEEVSVRLQEGAGILGLQVKTTLHFSLRAMTVTQGLGLTGRHVNIFEPVRHRRLFTKSWEETQPIQQAASKIGAALKEQQTNLLSEPN